MTSFSVQSFGCRVNQAEVFFWADKLQEGGLRYERDCFQSELVIVNSCTVTSRADRDVRKFVRNLLRVKPEARVIVTGCYVERAPQEWREWPHLWRIYSNQNKERIIQDILSSLDSKQKEAVLRYRSRALVKIQDGCNYACTFCIVPRVRGKSVSLKKEKILTQIRKFLSQGFREMVLTGIHICHYGLDLCPPTSLLKLLNEIESLEGLGRIRLSSLDPRLLPFSLAEHIVASQKICPHFHLSLQTGSDRILARMGRKIRVKRYQEILSYFRHKSPQASLGADIIAGFPGEREQDFAQTYRFLEDSPLTYFHVFSYSPRPGTPAAEWPQVPERVKKERAKCLRRLSAKKNFEFRRSFLGQELKAIIIKKGRDWSQLLTSNYIKVLGMDCSIPEGEEVRIKITEVCPQKTEGKIIFPSFRSSIHI